MKKIYFILSFFLLFGASGTFAQVNFVIDTSSLRFSFPNGTSFKVGDSIGVEYYVRNVGTTETLKAGDPQRIIYTSLQFSSDLKNVYTDSSKGGRELAGSGVGQTTFAKDSNYSIGRTFIKIDTKPSLPSSGTVIIVIWPTGAGVKKQGPSYGGSRTIVYSLVKESPESIHVRFYPNPAGNTVNLECAGPDVSARKIDIMDMQGRWIKSYIPLGNGNLSLDISDLSAGSYIFSVHFSDGSTGRYKLMRSE